MSEITIGPLGTGNEDELLAFYRENFCEWDQFRLLWPWRKALPEAVGSEGAIVARLDGVMVGSVRIVGTRVALGNRELRAEWQQNSLVSPSMRGRGIGLALIERALEGCDLSLAKGTSNAMYRLRKSAGYKDIPRDTYMVRVEKPRLRQGNYGRRLGELGQWGAKWVLSAIPSRRNLAVSVLSHFDEAFDILPGRMPADQVLRPVKSSTYLNWRYFSCPTRQYQVLGNPSFPGAVVVVVAYAERNRGEGWIVDLISDRRNTEANLALLSAGAEFLHLQGVERIFVFATLPQARWWLYRLGFFPLRTTPHFTIRPSQTIQLPSRVIADFWHGDGDMELYF